MLKLYLIIIYYYIHTNDKVSIIYAKYNRDNSINYN